MRTILIASLGLTPCLLLGYTCIMTDSEELPTLTLTWDAAPEPIVQAAQMITFYAAWPTAAGDSEELEGFRL